MLVFILRVMGGLWIILTKNHFKCLKNFSDPSTCRKEWMRARLGLQVFLKQPRSRRASEYSLGEGVVTLWDWRVTQEVEIRGLGN